MNIVESLTSLINEPVCQKRMQKLEISEVVVTSSLPTDTVISRLYTLTFTHQKTINNQMLIPVTQLASCCGVLVIHEIRLLNNGGYGNDPALVRHGIGRFFFDLVVDAFIRLARGINYDRHSGPGLLLATTTQYQSAGAALLQSRRWKKLEVFRNPNTGNVVTLWQKKLTTGSYDNL